MKKIIKVIKGILGIPVKVVKGFGRFFFEIAKAFKRMIFSILYSPVLLAIQDYSKRLIIRDYVMAKVD